MQLQTHSPRLIIDAVCDDGQRHHLNTITHLEIDCGNGTRLLIETNHQTAKDTLTIQKAVSKKLKAFTPKKKQIRQWVRSAFPHHPEITIRLVDEEEGHALNLEFRGKDYATNVLSFAYDGDLSDHEQASSPIWGDIALCVPVVVKEAGEQGKSLDAHYAHLIVHGILHLQGYDHENPRDAEIMEAIERRILATLGYADPYAS